MSQTESPAYEGKVISLPGQGDCFPGVTKQQINSQWSFQIVVLSQSVH